MLTVDGRCGGRDVRVFVASRCDLLPVGCSAEKKNAEGDTLPGCVPVLRGVLKEMLVVACLFCGAGGHPVDHDQQDQHARHRGEGAGRGARRYGFHGQVSTGCASILMSHLAPVRPDSKFLLA